MTLHMTGKMDLARGSKAFPPWKRFENEVAPQSACRPRAKSEPPPPRWRVHWCTPWASNFMRKMSKLPALVCPSSELVVPPATQALPTSSTCAKIDSWALQCAADARGNWKKNWGISPSDREKMKWESMITPNHCKCKNYEKHWTNMKNCMPHCVRMKPRNLKSTPISTHTKWSQMSDLFSDDNGALAETCAS